MRSIEFDISNNLDGPLNRFQGHVIFEVEYLKNGESYGQCTVIGNHT